MEVTPVTAGNKIELQLETSYFLLNRFFLTYYECILKSGPYPYFGYSAKSVGLLP